jgi:hypothetical protein
MVMKLRSAAKLTLSLAAAYLVLGSLLFVLRFTTSWGEEIWRALHMGIVLVMSAVAFASGIMFSVLSSRLKQKPRSVEQTIVLMLSVASLLFGLGAAGVAVVEDVLGELFMSGMASTFVNIPFLFAALTMTIAMALLIISSRAILSPRRQIVTMVFSVIVFGVTGVFLVLPVFGGELTGIYRILSIYYAVFSLLTFVGGIFALSAFHSPGARKYWGPITLGIFILAASTLIVFFLRSRGMTRASGFTFITNAAAFSLMIFAAINRLKKVNN